MIQTTSLHNVICSELEKEGFDELENNGEWTFFNPEFSFMKKILQFDDDVQSIVNNKLFLGEGLDDPEADHHFKKTFIQKFANNSINAQTIEAFAQKVVYTFLVYQDYLNNVYQIDDYIKGKQISEGQTKNEGTKDNRLLESELPQTEVNVNVDDTVLDYGNRNTLTRDKNQETMQDNKTTQSYDLDRLIQSSGLLDGVMIEFNKNCFMQVF